MALLNKYLLATLLITTGGLVYIISKKYSQKENINSWMSKLPDTKKIVLINIPGTHDSTAFNTLMTINKYAQTQSLNITEQLNIGVRKFDIRAVLNVAKDELICCHGPAYCYYRDAKMITRFLLFKIIISEMKKFLEENPTETVYLSFKSCFGDTSENLKAASELFEKMIPETMKVKYNKALILGETRGKFIYDFYKTDDESGLDEIHRKYGDYEAYKVDGNQKVKELKELFEKCDQTSIENAEADFNQNQNKYPLSYSISCTGEKKNMIPQPKKMSEIVNSFVLNYNMKKGYYYGWINIDFVEKIIVEKIINTNF